MGRGILMLVFFYWLLRRKFAIEGKNHNGISRTTEDYPGDVKSEGWSIVSFESSVAEMNSCRGVATRWDLIPYGTGEKSKDPKSIWWDKVQAVHDSNSKLNDGTATIELFSCDKSRGGTPILHYSTQSPLTTPPMLSSALLLAQNS